MSVLAWEEVASVPALALVFAESDLLAEPAERERRRPRAAPRQRRRQANHQRPY